jgi:hypothetical protein
VVWLTLGGQGRAVCLLQSFPLSPSMSRGQCEPLLDTPTMAFATSPTQ